MRPLAVAALLALAAPAAAQLPPPVAGSVTTVDPSRATSPSGVRASSERAYGSSRTVALPAPAAADVATEAPAAPDVASLLGALLGAALAGDAPESAEPTRSAVATAPVVAAHPGEPVRVRAPRSNEAPPVAAPGEPVRMRPDAVTGAIPGIPVVVED